MYCHQGHDTNTYMRLAEKTVNYCLFWLEENEVKWRKISTFYWIYGRAYDHYPMLFLVYVCIASTCSWPQFHFCFNCAGKFLIFFVGKYCFEQYNKFKWLIKTCVDSKGNYVKCKYQAALHWIISKIQWDLLKLHILQFTIEHCQYIKHLIGIWINFRLNMVSFFLFHLYELIN